MFLYIAQRMGFLILRVNKYLLPLLLLVLNVSPSKAQEASFWSQRERIPEYFDATEEPPYLIADKNHTVHAFNSQPLNLGDPNSFRAVFYRQWTPENGWSYPNDILVDMNGENIYLLGVAYDNLGVAHLITQSGDRIYYTQNYLANAGSAASWSTPILVTENSSGFGPGYEIVSAIATSPDGNDIIIIFSGNQNGNGLYFTTSSDGGGSWAPPYPIYLTGDESMIVTDPKLYLGSSGKLHAVWSTFLEGGAGGPGYYANFSFEENTWNEPVELDTSGIRTPSVIEYHDNVIVSYYHENINGNWWRQSTDGGETWTAPRQVSPGHVGTTGQVSFVVDGNDVLNAFYGNRINDANHGVWQSVWTNNNWTNPDAVVRGPEVKDKVGGEGFAPRSARAIVSNGNVILVTWGTDGFQGTNGAWYSYKYIDAPETPSESLPLPMSTPDVSLSPTDNMIPTDVEPSTTPDLGVDFGSPPLRLLNSPQSLILIGVVPVVLLLIGLFVVGFFSNIKHR